jgi:hypothetical protein
MAANPVNWRRWRMVPLLCVEAFSVNFGLRKIETGTATDQGWPELIKIGNSKHSASRSYHAPWFELSTGLCATRVWNSPSTTGLSSSHCVEPAVMNSGSHTQHKMSRFNKSRHPRGKGLSRCAYAVWPIRKELVWCHNGHIYLGPGSVTGCSHLACCYGN